MKYNYFLICCALFLFGPFGKTSAQVKIIQTIAGSSAGYSGDGGGATAAKLNDNYFIALDATGNLYIADYGNHRIREIYTNGIIATIAGTGTAGYSADNIPASTSQLNYPEGVAVDASGNVYIGDLGNNRIRKFTASTGVITTIAGTGTPGYTGDGAAATLAQIDSPRGVAVDPSGNIYFAEGGNTTRRVRMVTASTGFISTLAGTTVAGYSGDFGPANVAELNAPRGVWADASGNVYIADMSNNRIRLVAGGSSLITTVVNSTGTAGFSGDGSGAYTAEISAPTDMKLDASGDLYIADVNNERIRLVSGGIISTVAGSGSMGFAGDGSPATAAAVKLNAPVSIAILPNGNFYISDRSNSRIRLVRNNSTPYFTGGSHQSFTVCENTTANSINTYLTINDSDLGQTETWSINTAPHHGAYVLGGAVASNAGQVTPTGSTYTPTTGYSGLDTFVVQISDGYATSLDTLYVTINPLPVVAPITGPNMVCVGSAITVHDVTGSGVWSASNSNATAGAGTGLVTGMAAGTVSISYTVINSCGPTSSLYTVTVNPLPNAGTISGLPDVCVGSTISLTDIVSGGVWSSSAPAIGSVDGSGAVYGAATGTATISYSYTNSCGTAVATSAVTVITTPPTGAISGPSSVCAGSSITLTDAGGSGGVWSAANTNATVGAATGFVNGVLAGADIISYTVTNVCGSASATYPVTINPLPAAGTITGPAGVCVSSFITLADGTGSGTGVWSSPSATVTVGAGTGVVTGVSGGTAIISYSVTNVCGTAVTTYAVSVITTPTAGVITGPGSVCQGAGITLSDAITGGIWSRSNATATVGTATGVVTGVSGGVDTITYSVSYTCGSAYTTATVTINPLPTPAAISGPSSVCLGSSATVTDASAGGVWSVANGHATVSASGLVTSVSAGIDTIKYSLTNGCGTVAATYSITVSPIVTPSVSISANPGFTSCPGALVTYSATPVYGGVSPAYQWIVNGTIVAATQSFVYSPSNGDILVINLGSDAACTSVSTVTDTVRVVVNPDKAPAVSISTGIYGLVECAGTNTPFTATPTNGGTAPTYQWLVNGVNTGTGNPFYYTPNNGDMISAILTSSYACAVPATAISNTVTMTVNTTETPSVSIIASPGTNVCAGTDVTFTALPIYGGIAPILRWTKDSINVATGPIYHYVPVNGDNVYCMLTSSASCSTLDSVFSNTIDLTVNPNVIPVISITAASTYISVGQATTFTANVTGTSSPTYQWYVNGAAIPGATSATYTLTGSNAGAATVTCIAGSSDACSTTVASNAIIVTVSGLGVASLTTAGGFTLLPNPNNGTFTIEGTLSANANSATIEVTDLLGKTVYSQVAPVQNGALKAGINLNNELANGVYILHIITGDANKVLRFTISR